MFLDSQHTISKIGFKGKRLNNGLRELITRTELAKQADLFGGLVNSWIRDSGDVTLMPILHGGAWIWQRLLRRIDPESTHEERALVAQSYGDNQSAEPVRVYMDWVNPDRHIAGRHVLLIDDIFDSGDTMVEAIRKVERFKPASIEVLFMLKKRRPNQARLHPRWVMFEVDDVWVVGAGLDDGGKRRHLPYIAEKPRF